MNSRPCFHEPRGYYKAKSACTAPSWPRVAIGIPIGPRATESTLDSGERSHTSRLDPAGRPRGRLAQRSRGRSDRGPGAPPCRAPQCNPPCRAPQCNPSSLSCAAVQSVRAQYQRGRPHRHAATPFCLAAPPPAAAQVRRLVLPSSLLIRIAAHAWPCQEKVQQAGGFVPVATMSRCLADSVRPPSSPLAPSLRSLYARPLRPCHPPTLRRRATRVLTRGGVPTRRPRAGQHRGQAARGVLQVPPQHLAWRAAPALAQERPASLPYPRLAPRAPCPGRALGSSSEVCLCVDARRLWTRMLLPKLSAGVQARRPFALSPSEVGEGGR